MVILSHEGLEPATSSTHHHKTSMRCQTEKGREKRSPHSFATGLGHEAWTTVNKMFPKQHSHFRKQENSYQYALNMGVSAFPSQVFNPEKWKSMSTPDLVIN